jgi:antitoxin ParD1/3/4
LKKSGILGLIALGSIAIDIVATFADARPREARFAYNEVHRDRLECPMQITLSPELEQLVQRQIDSGKYQTAIEVILAGVQLLEQQNDPYQGRSQDLQQDALLGWEAAQRGEVVDGATAMQQIRANLHLR